MSAKAWLKSASWHWHSTSSAGLRPGQIGSPTPRMGRAGAAGDEVAPGGDDARRVVAEVAHVDELDVLGGGAQAAAQRAQLRRLEGDHHRLAGGDAVLDERRDTVQERLRAGVEDGLVAELLGGEHGEGNQTKALPNLWQASRMRRLGLATLCSRRAWPSPARARRRSGALAADRHDLAADRLLPGRHLRSRRAAVLRRRLRRPVPDRRRAAPRAAARRRHPGRRDRARGLQPHRRHHLGPRARAGASCCRSSATPHGPNGGNPCRTGSIGVADPRTLRWRYYVKLEPAEIPKAMWAEVSPDGTLLWTSAGTTCSPTAPPTSRRQRRAGGTRRSARCGGCAARCRRPASPARRSSTGGCCVAGQDGEHVPGLVDRPRHRRAPARDRARDRRRVRGARDARSAGRWAGSSSPSTPSRSRRPTARITRRC